MNKKYNVSIIPAGQWGSALSIPIAKNGHHVSLWFYVKEEHDFFQRIHKHPRLPGAKFDSTVRSTTDLESAAKDADIIILGPKCSATRELAQKLSPHIKPDTKIVTISKGLEAITHNRMSEIIVESGLTDWDHLAVLSGPNFAVEVASGLPAVTAIASKNQKLAEELQTAFGSPNFRVYTSNDIVGVEIGGALKNVIAIGVGICDGMNMGDNARAALITRGLAEIAKIGTKLGANPQTFLGLSGMGDLVLTCTSEKSRNYSAGLAIGRGSTLLEITKASSTIEGLNSISSALDLAEKLKIDAPLTLLVNQIVLNNLPPKEAMRQLLSRQPYSEFI